MFFGNQGIVKLQVKFIFNDVFGDVIITKEIIYFISSEYLILLKNELKKKEFRTDAEALDAVFTLLDRGFRRMKRLRYK